MVVHGVPFSRALTRQETQTALHLIFRTGSLVAPCDHHIISLSPRPRWVAAGRAETMTGRCWMLAVLMSPQCLSGRSLEAGRTLSCGG